MAAIGPLFKGHLYIGAAQEQPRKREPGWLARTYKEHASWLLARPRSSCSS